MPPFIFLTIAWMIGIALTKWLQPPPFALLSLAILPLGCLVLYYQHLKIRWLAIYALACLLGAARLLIAQPTINAAHVAYYNDSDYLTLTAKIIDEPDIRDTYTNLRVQAQQIQYEDGEPIPVKGLVLVRAGRYPQYNYGDTLQIYAKLETPPVFESFSYKDYLARQGIYAIVRRPYIKRIAEQSGFSLKANIIQIKTKAHHSINRILPEPHAALLNGILLGIEQGIPESLYDSFNATGASHVIVISGSNISLVVALLLLLGQKTLGKRNATFLAIGGVVLYVMMVGADAAVVRAAIMGIMFVIAMFVGRPGVVLNTLFVSGFLITAQNPLALWDVGFQLSFLATLGLIILVPPLEYGVAKLLTKFSLSTKGNILTDLLNEALLVTVAAQIITTPLIVYQFERFSVVSLLTNFLIVPVQPFVMILGGLATIVGMVSVPLGQIIGWLAWLPLAWTIEIVNWTADFWWAQIDLPQMPAWLMVLLYITIGAFVWWFNQPSDGPRLRLEGGQVNQTKVLTVLGTGAGLVLLIIAIRALPDGYLHIAFLDVGQGDAILITTPNGRQILIDGGPSPAELGQRLGEEMPFWDHSLDMVINTHPDADHLAGLVNLLNRYEVDSILVSDAESKSALYREWVNQLETHQKEEIIAWEGMKLQLDEQIEAIVLNPGPHSQSAEAPNDHSVTLKISMGNVSFLLSGDIEFEVERALAKSDLDLKATVLKSPHHGSNTSSDPLFLEAVNPQLVVISVGEDNRFGHPTEKILQRYQEYGIPVLRTDELGTVELVTNGEVIWLNTH